MKENNKKLTIHEICFEDYKANNIEIKKFKLIHLKDACKRFNLKVSGKKQVLYDRIMNYFLKIDSAIKLQSTCRMHFAKTYVLKRGPAIKNRKLCNNNSDFVTLEPIDEIPFEYFFSFEDDNNFIYGFNIVSLLQSMKKVKNFENPYNRSPFSKSIKKQILQIYNCSYLLNAEFRIKNNFYRKPTKFQLNQRFINTIRPNYEQHISNVDNYQPFFDRRLINMTEEMENQLQIIQQNRTLNVNERVNRLFTEIDNLGNYTSNDWFQSLTHIQFIRLYRTLYDIWIIRGQLGYQVKRSICPFHDPFDGIFPRRFYHETLNTEQIKKACIIVMENLVFSGINLDFRKIGALHALTALTMVSIPARQAMPWLYESIV